MKRNPVAARLLELLVRRAIRKRFHAIRVAGEEHLPHGNESAIFCANHTNWWDGFVAVALGALRRGTRTYVWQEADVLARYRFFELAGAVPIDLSNPYAALGGVREALRLLKHPGAAFWLFPQGRLASPAEPVTMRPGAVLLARRSRCAIQPVAFRWHWLEESRPTILVRFGPALRSDAHTTADAIQSLVERIDQDAEQRELGEYRSLFPPGRSIHHTYDALRRRWSGLTRPPQL